MLIARNETMPTLPTLYQGFQQDGNVQLFGTKEQKFLYCPGTQGQHDKLKILPLDRTGRDSLCQNPGRDAERDNHYFSVKIRDGMQDVTGQHYFFQMIFCSRTYFFCFRMSFPDLELPFLFWNVPFLFWNVFFLLSVFFLK